MARYIDANKLVEAILDSLGKDTHRTPEASLVHRQEHHHLLHIITKQPTADVEEVKHGEWIESVFEEPPKLAHGRLIVNKHKVFECSICNVKIVGLEGMIYCPFCGANNVGR